MKAIFKYTLASLLGVGMFSSCSQDLLDTNPSTAVATEQMTASTGSAIAAIDGMYRWFYVTGMTTGWQAEEFGISALTLAADEMGEDHIQAKSGSGWFYYDYLYMVKGDYTNTAGRPYGVWNFFYTLIANANYVIAAENTMEGSTSDMQYVVGQAYALRAYSYFMLAQWYARTLVGHENEPCVPIYTEPTDKNTQGKPRETVATVFKQIDSDIAKAEELLTATAHKRNSRSHITACVAHGIHARIALVEEKWADAKKYAELAIAAAKNEGIDIAEVSEFKGCNKADARNVMWGFNIIADQVTYHSSFFAHLDADQGTYGASAPQQITRDLYAKMGEKDARLIWWDPTNPKNGANGYQQEKFKFVNKSTWEGDYIQMRIEEMYLTLAEAECMLGNDAAAQEVLNGFMAYRDPDYNCAKTGKDLGVTTDILTGSLREEILIQRRIELWSEFGRLYDIRRTHQGFIRYEDQGHPAAAVRYSAGCEDPENYRWVMVIPQSEFDGNASLDPSKDQNPFD